jgi:hypothetical protein
MEETRNKLLIESLVVINLGLRKFAENLEDQDVESME